MLVKIREKSEKSENFENSENSENYDHLEYHVRPFMIKHGFYGLGSEEGMEQAHNEFEADMNIVSRMKCASRRVDAFLRRQNSSVSPELAPILQKLDPKKRGSYQPTDKRKRRRIEQINTN